MSGPRPSRLRTAARLLFSPRLSRLQLSTSDIVGHLQLTRGGLWAWFQLGEQPWAFTSTAQRQVTHDAVTYRYTELAGRPIKIRSTSRPYPAYEFARSFDLDSPDRLPDVPGAPSWDDLLEYSQRRVHDSSLDESQVMLGVWVRGAVKRDLLHALWALDQKPQGELAQLLDEIAQVNDKVQGDGLRAVPLKPSQMAFLMHRSCAPGVPAPVHAGAAGRSWYPDDILAFTDPVEWHHSPLGRTVEVVADYAGNRVRRHVAVVSMGRMPARNFPEDGHDPWMLAAEKLPFPVEWSVSGRVLKQTELAETSEFEQNRAVNIAAHYAEHAELLPPAVDRAIAESRETHDQVTEGDARDGVRFLGPIRAAVYAPTEDECMARVRKLIDFYGEKHRIELVHTKGQAAKLREFIPGEPWSMSGYQRRLPAAYLAAAMPHVATSAGTPTGPYVAYTLSTSRRAVRHDGHYGPERLNTPGLTPIVAEPGAGKSTLTGALAFISARRGEPTVVLDPSGPLGALCDMREFDAPRPGLPRTAQRLDLMHSPAGTLAPWQLVPEPRAEDFADSRDPARDFERAQSRAAAERKQLAADAFRMVLPTVLLRNPDTDSVIREAIRRMGGGPRVNARTVLPILDSLNDPHAVRIGRELRDAAEFPLGELLFPGASEDEVEAGSAGDATLVVISMPGLVIPDASVEPEQWSNEERYAMPLLHLASFFTTRFLYSRPRNQRKNAFLDENHFMGQWGSGRAMFVRLSRDSRKIDAAVYAASQHPQDHLSIGRIDALMGAAFVGRLEDPDVAREATKLLRCPPEYASTVTRLSPKPPPGHEGSADTGEFLYRDPLGRVNKIKIDLDWYPGLRQVLTTTPEQHRRMPRMRPASAMFLDDDHFDDYDDSYGGERDAAAGPRGVGSPRRGGPGDPGTNGHTDRDLAAAR